MIAITGANGLLGSFIVRRLIQSNENFIALKRKNSDISLLRDVNHLIQWRDTDISDPISLDEALNGATSVIHAAAMVTFNPRLAKKLLDTNVGGTRNVINVSLAQNVKRFVHISSVAALGRIKNQTLIDENNKWTTSSLNTAYAESKYLAELEVFRGQEEGLSTITVNPSVILAPTDWTKSSAKLFKYVWDEKPYYIDGKLNYVDVRDVSEVVYRLMMSPMENQRFIVNAGSITFHDFFKKVASAFNKKAPSIKLNRSFLRIAARAEAMRSWIAGSDPLITSETARLANTDFRYENNKIKKTLNFEFQSLDNTLEWCCNHYRSNLGLKNT